MEASRNTTRIEDLLVHASWVNGLALRLVADSATAEDLVQETWLKALSTPPQHADNLRGWLGGVLRNTLRQRQRGAGRRTQREQSVADSREQSVADSREQHCSPEELVERVETQRRLAALVLQLDEPLRQTLVLHFYEGLSAARIARQQELAESTVRSRLARGLELLRGKLDDDFESRHAWFVLLCPLARRHVPVAETSGLGVSALLQGLIAMHIAWKLTIATLALILLVALSPLGRVGLEFARSLRPIELVPLETSFRPFEHEVAREPSSASSTSELASRAAAALAPGRASTAPTSSVSLRVLGPERQAISGAAVFLRMDSTVRAETDASGELTLPLHSELDSSYAQELLIDDPRYLRAALEFQFRSGESVELGDVQLRACGAIEGVVIDAEGEPVPGAKLGLDELDRDRAGLERERLNRSARLHLLNDEVCDEEGRFYLARQPLGRHLLWAAAPGQLAGYVQPVEVRAQHVTEGVVIQLGTYDPAHFIAGIVLDPAGQPVARARLNVEYDSWRRSGSQSLNADREGRFLLSYAHEVPLTIRARDREGRFGAAARTEVEGGEEHLVLRLSQPSWMEVEVRGPAGLLEDPLVAVYDEQRRDGLVSWDGVQVEGALVRFIKPNEAFVIVVECEGHDRQQLGPFNGSSAPDRITASLNSLPGVRGAVLARGEALPGARLELRALAQQFTEKNGFPLRVEDSAETHGVSDSRGNFNLTLRNSGSYMLRVTAEGFAPGERGPFDIDSAFGLDGLEVELDQGGAIEGRVLVSAAETAAGKIVAISRADAHAETQRVGRDGAFRFEHLIPGEWFVTLRDEEISEHESSSSSDMRPFSEALIPGNCVVASGETTRFDLDLAGGAAEVALEGLLMLDGQPCTGWEAQLTPEGQMTSSLNESKTNSDATDGSFHLVAPRPGRYRLQLAPADDSGRIFSCALELFPGVTSWSRSFSTAALEVRNVQPLGELGLPLDFFLSSVEGVDVLAPIVGSASDTTPDLMATLEGLPVGAGRIVRFTLEELSTMIEIPTQHAALVEVDLLAGRTSSVRLP